MASAKDVGKNFLSWMNKGLTANPSITLFIVISLVIHLIDVFSDFRNTNFRIFAYLVLTIAAWLSLFKDQENPGVINIANIKVPVILSSIAIFAPYLGGVLPFLGSSQSFQTAIIFFPAWVLFLCFAMGQNWFIIICRWIIVLLLLFLVFPTIINGFINDLRIGEIETGINVQQTISNTMRDLSYGVNSALTNIGKAWKDAYNSLIKTATGDYYTGKVDEYEDEPVGVYLEDLQAADSKFFEGEKITVWAVLKAKTLGDKEININVSCYAKEGNKKVGGSIIPQNEFNIATEEEEYLDCTFDKLNPGKMDVTFNAEFNFETMAYLKTYFMDKESLRALTREGIDVFSHYKISNINPIAIYTNGPVGIGMRTAEPLPVGVYSDKENIPFFFGITIENNWEGTIKKVTGLEIQVHDSLELTNCDHVFEFKENEDGYNIYSLVPDKRTEDIKTRKFHSIQCRLNPVDPKSLLGNEPITTRYFRVTASYVYELEKSVPVEVEKVEDYKSPEEEVMTSDEKAQEFKDKLNEMVDGKTNNEIACNVISKCSDYDANYYDKLGFNDQTWCDTNPCNLDCYSAFEKSGDEVSYDSCKECPYYMTIQDLPREDYCNIYLAEDYCEKDICNFRDYNIECQWYDNKCMMGFLKKEEWKDYDESEVKAKLREAAQENNIPPEILLGVAYTETGGTFNKDLIGDEGDSIGLMQINFGLHKNECNLESKDELFDINKNIECSIKILKNHYNNFCSVSGSERFRNKVDDEENGCINPIFNEKYKSYSYEYGCWNMALRAYNGFGCQNEIIAGYVERVRNNIKEQGFD
ncbi:hypothetical protein AUJ83_02240 [Candidatus Woesearchaeota archaeon CG1_02_33_12]|nr:MAG: hypothetical protein AUJ83_02240 [Candidatus Woesearchaeota archaeon CG1_02_33_12]PIN78854.1 MAG: hypothetical protein COV14_01890 [Candidatus Woesearchaeota archaeon CG10_big_fil_rev_8_21_14_0_10_33_12]PIU72088.1 MAG: hypothetical protein COS79_04800 [Candidatus Woesearchaeota archaeon CG06_land_8_20_14_3_00_33_13]